MYGADSTITYTFGDITFNTASAKCKVHKSGVPDKDIAKCVLTDTTVAITPKTTISSIGFTVEIFNAAKNTWTNDNAITAKLNSFGAD
jgi:hypothetical protein